MWWMLDSATCSGGSPLFEAEHSATPSPDAVECGPEAIPVSAPQSDERRHPARW